MSYKLRLRDIVTGLVVAGAVEMAYAYEDKSGKGLVPINVNQNVTTTVELPAVNIYLPAQTNNFNLPSLKPETVYVDTNKAVPTVPVAPVKPVVPSDGMIEEGDSIPSDSNSNESIIPSDEKLTENVPSTIIVPNAPNTDYSYIATGTGLLQIYEQFNKGGRFVLQQTSGNAGNETRIALGGEGCIYSNDAFNATLDGNIKSLIEGDNEVYQINLAGNVFGNTIGAGFGFIDTWGDNINGPTYVYLKGKFGVGSGKDVAASIEGIVGSTVDPKIGYGAKGNVFVNLNPNWRTYFEGGKSNFGDLLEGNQGYFNMKVLNGKEGKNQYGVTAGVTSSLDMDDMRKADRPISDLYGKSVISAGPTARIYLSPKDRIDLDLTGGAQFNGDNTANQLVIKLGIKYVPNSAKK